MSWLQSKPESTRVGTEDNFESLEAMVEAVESVEAMEAKVIMVLENYERCWTQYKLRELKKFKLRP